MTPQQTISALDRALATAGETIRLQRLALGPGDSQIPFEVSCRALVRGYQPDELVNGITQQDQLIIISPTQIIANGWPGAAPVRGPGDQRVPQARDRTITSRGTLTVQAAVGIYLQGELVRIEMQVRGN